MRIAAERLRELVRSVFTATGSGPHEAERIGHYLVEANLVGHDSHGVIRVPPYVEWVRAGKLLPNQQLKIVSENEAIAVVDGQFGFGQVMGEEAMKLAIAKSARHGVAVVALRNSGHIGRIGDWAEMAARAGKMSLHFVNTNGGGILVAPHGGIQRRLSANPIAAGVPTRQGPPIILDMSTCTIAEGKIKVAFNKGVTVPDNCILDGRGQPTNDPKVFYSQPPGVILPIAGHKGYALSFIVEMLAGALTGGSCSAPDVKRVVNNMTSIVIDQSFFQSRDEFDAEVERFTQFVKSSDKVSPGAEILTPGELEARNRARNVAMGIELDETTWSNLRKTAQLVGVPQPTV
jgi:uncharacterized oxidoreductase